MTEEIRRSRLTANAISRIRNRAISGIAWGTNAHPAHSLLGWFGGTTAPPTASWDNNSWGPVSNTDGQQVANALRYVTNLFGGIRLARIVIYMANDTGSTVLTDNTAVAHLANFVPAFTNNVPLAVANGTEMSLAVFDQSCEAMWNAYVSACRSTPLLLTNTICHTSCHSSCHLSRGRR